MDSRSRKTASVYINNLLLSRGLLRNGNPIEFAHPEQAEGGVNAVMAQVMNLVHDLILRRDRESDTLTALSENLQSLRASSTHNTQTITRLENKNADLDRQLALTVAQERAARATLKSAETRNKALREEMTRLKGSVAQIRAQCATDVRRRDGEIQRLKRHLEGRRGREGNAGQVGIVVIIPGPSKVSHGARNSEPATDLENPAYSLKQETTEFLTQLSQSLSDENDSLIGLVRGTLATLRSLQGLPNTGPDSNLVTSVDEVDYVNGFAGNPPSCETLAANIDEVLEHLRGLLTNPSFVPLEEVEVREDEIHRLRDGWEKMAARWKEAMALLDGWRQRMVDTGDTINLNDLRIGMELGSEIPTVQEAQDRSLMKSDEKADVNESDILQDMQEDAEQCSNLGADDVNKVDIDVHATDRALTAKDPNFRSVPSPRKFSFEPIAEEDSKALTLGDELSLLDFSTYKAPKESPTKVKSPVPLQKQHLIQSPTQTVQQKLERAQLEAEEARKRDENRPKTKNMSKQTVTKKLRGSRRRSTLSPEELENLMGLV